MRKLNVALNDLKECLPAALKTNKNGQELRLTKIKTLKTAIIYIDMLVNILHTKVM